MSTSEQIPTQDKNQNQVDDNLKTMNQDVLIVHNSNSAEMGIICMAMSRLGARTARILQGVPDETVITEITKLIENEETPRTTICSDYGTLNTNVMTQLLMNTQASFRMFHTNAERNSMVQYCSSELKKKLEEYNEDVDALFQERIELISFSEEYNITSVYDSEYDFSQFVNNPDVLKAFQDDASFREKIFTIYTMESTRIVNEDTWIMARLGNIPDVNALDAEYSAYKLSLNARYSGSIFSRVEGTNIIASDYHYPDVIDYIGFISNLTNVREKPRPEDAAEDAEPEYERYRVNADVLYYMIFRRTYAKIGDNRKGTYVRFISLDSQFNTALRSEMPKKLQNLNVQEVGNGVVLFEGYSPYEQEKVITSIRQLINHREKLISVEPAPDTTQVEEIET